MADSIWPQIHTRSLAKTKPKHRKVSFTGRLHLFTELKLFLPIHLTIICIISHSLLPIYRVCLLVFTFFRNSIYSKKFRFCFNDGRHQNKMFMNINLWSWTCGSFSNLVIKGIGCSLGVYSGYQPTQSLMKRINEPAFPAGDPNYPPGQAKTQWTTDGDDHKR